MKYRVEYEVIGPESGGVDSQTFDANSNADADKQADELIAKAQRECNGKIDSRYWHYKFKRTKLVRITQEEISEPVHV